MVCPHVHDIGHVDNIVKTATSVNTAELNGEALERALKQRLRARCPAITKGRCQSQHAGSGACSTRVARLGQCGTEMDATGLATSRPTGTES